MLTETMTGDLTTAGANELVPTDRPASLPTSAWSAAGPCAAKIGTALGGGPTRCGTIGLYPSEPNLNTGCCADGVTPALANRLLES